MVSRRQVLLSGLSLAGSAAAFSVLPKVPLWWQSMTTSPHKMLIVGEQQEKQWYLASVRMDTYQMRRVALSFTPHSYVQDPKNLDHVWAIEKWGPTASLVDVRSHRIVQTLNAPEGGYFFGHGFFYPGSRTMFFSCVDKPSLQGYLLGIDADNFSVQQRFNVVRANIHESKVLPDGTVLVASCGTAGGTPLGMGPEMYRTELPSLVHCNPHTGKVLGKLTIPDQKQMLSHFALFEDGHIIALSRGERDNGRVYKGRVGGRSLTRIDLGADNSHEGLKEMLSVAADETNGKVLVTAEGAGRLLMFDGRSGAYQGSILAKDGIHARSVAYDPERNWFIAASRDGVLAIPADVTPETLSERSMSLMEGHFTGAHSKLITI